MNRLTAGASSCGEEWSRNARYHCPSTQTSSEALVNLWPFVISTCQLHSKTATKNHGRHPFRVPSRISSTKTCWNPGRLTIILSVVQGEQTVNTKWSHHDLHNKPGCVSHKHAGSTSWTCCHQSNSYAFHLLFAGENQIKIMPSNLETMLRN